MQKILNNSATVYLESPNCAKKQNAPKCVKIIQTLVTSFWGHGGLVDRARDFWQGDLGFDPGFVRPLPTGWVG